MTLGRLPTSLFVFTTGALADINTAILTAFGEANDRLDTALSRDEVRALLREVGWFDPIEDAELAKRLTALENWELLDPVQDGGHNYRTAEEYERNNLRYSLTKQGEAAIAALERAHEILSSAGALQTSVLDAIADRLDDLYKMHTGTVLDRRIYTAVTELEGHLEALRTNTQQFNGQLQRLLRPQETDVEVFRAVKSATVSYLQEFCADLDKLAERIRLALARVEEQGAEDLHRRALAGAELPPTIGTAGRDDWLAQRRRRWAGLRTWFGGGDPRVRQLHDLARKAIITLLNVLERFEMERRRASSTVADLRTLARWFAQTDTESEAHLLFGAAFGLTSARHAHLHHDDPERHSPTERWDQSPVPVSATLRTSGRVAHQGRPANVRDTAAIRRKRRAEAAIERAQVEAAWRLLHTGGEVRLSDVGRLPADGFSRFLELLGLALESKPGPDRSRRASTSDGRTWVRLRPTGDDRVAVLVTDRGELRGPDWFLTIGGSGE
ncbi:TIGR02677 family protein [Phytomonospora sp. NPDC050363]|uniref:TIGR02677 family protein n=1 Tax=Phytomonospora sp. NPDC050363 TaxID=3155642 RepID=UPI0033D72AC8